MEDSARGRSGVSRMRRVFRGGVGAVEDREDMAVARVVFKCVRSSEVRVKCAGLWLVVLVCGGAGEGVGVLGAGCAGCAVGGGGPLAGTARPGGPRTGSICPGVLGWSISLVGLAGRRPVWGCCG